MPWTNFGPLGSFFLKQNPSEANLTLDGLKEMLQSNSYDSFMSKLMHYAKNVTGTNAYWNKARDNLKSNHSAELGSTNNILDVAMC